MKPSLAFSLILFSGFLGQILGGVSGFFLGGALGNYFFGSWGWLFGLFFGLFVGNWIGWILGILPGKRFKQPFPWLCSVTQFFSIVNGMFLGMLIGMLLGLKIATKFQIDPSDFFSFFCFWFLGVFFGSLLGECFGYFIGTHFTMFFGHIPTTKLVLDHRFAKAISIFIVAVFSSGIGYWLYGEPGSITGAIIGILIGRGFWQLVHPLFFIGRL